ncbi:MAG: polyribonucleotide nucleotidyltransferase [Candidatus Marinimicrobia bacterium]|nr:polyribonucleotide nucleotidyltransferase [Candidatus Neomarinimicrobiota bacterium]
MFGGRPLSIETGRMAKQANGSVFIQYGETAVLVTAAANLNTEVVQDFFPLQCEYKEKAYASGKFPGGFYKRESRPGDDEVLTARLMDRPIRPMFEEGFMCETQVIATLLSSDQINPGDVLGITGASCALLISDIPYHEAIAGVRVGKIGDEFIINPTFQQIENSELEIVVAGSMDSVVMVEGELNEVNEETLVSAIEFAHGEIKKLIDLQLELFNEIKPVKVPVVKLERDPELLKIIREKTEPHLQQWQEFARVTKKTREKAISQFTKELIKELGETYPDSAGIIIETIDEILKEDMRKLIAEKNIRLDGRQLNEIRPITCELDILARAHGSALFTRGETQSLGATTLGTKRDEQIIDNVGQEEFKKNFYLHYNFPPFSVGEVGRLGSPKRREIGHGNLAERALKKIVPNDENFPYTIRCVSEVLESNGSSSMASVCSGSLSLMAAGVPIKKTVAGIAMGLITTETEPFVLSDIQGAEDHFGDMDFKVTGTKDGITAIQMDLKVKGISTDTMRIALEQARKGRLHIIDIMEQTISEPRPDIAPHAPKIVSLKIDPGRIGEIIGPGGKNIKALQEKTQTVVEIEDDGTVVISAPNTANAEAAREMIIKSLEEPEVGKIYEDCPITRLESYGAFVNILPGTDGLLHISELEWDRTKDINEKLKVGDTITVKLVGIADRGKLELSRKVLLPKPEGYVERPPRKPEERNGSRDRKDRKDFHGGRDRRDRRRD